MESLRELIEKRNKLVHDAREILSRGEIGSDEKSKADELLDAAGDLDGKIEARQKDDSRLDRLTALESRLSETIERQTTPSRPTPRRTQSEDPAEVTIGRHKLSFRPGSDEAKLATPEYSQRFSDYLLGHYTGVRGHERLGLVTGDNSKGGYLAPVGMVAMMIKFLDNQVFMRQLGTVLPPTSEKSVGALSYDADPGDADWTAEVPSSDISEDDTARFGKREMIPHLLTKLLKMSRKILRASTLNIESFFAERLAYKFAVTEEKAFLTGTGAQQPLGVFTASNDGITTSQDITCASATVFTGDELINALYDLKEPYMQRATWLASRTFIKMARKLKDGNSQYLWQPGLGGQPGTLLDRPYVMSEYVPSTYTTGQYIAAIGDFSHYWIQDGMGLEIQRLEELFSLRNQVGFLARKETDAMPVLAEAFRRIKLG